MSTSHLFLSYNTEDRDAVQSVNRLLRDRGVDTFMDRDSLPPGMPWPMMLENALEASSAMAAFIGPDGLGTWQKREIWFALDHQARQERRDRIYPVIPVLLPGADVTTGFLFLNTWIDLRHAPIDTRCVEMLERAAQGSLDIPKPSYESICPYRGLNAFREEDSALFVGRDALAERLLETVKKREVATLVGPSGSGKSSLVRAGLVPGLRRLRPPDPTWDIVIFTPNEEPFHRLASAIIPLLEPGLDEIDRAKKARSLTLALTSETVALEDLVERLLAVSNGTDRLLLVVDQFEELLSQTLPQHRAPFVRMLLQAVSRCPLKLVLTLRADFYDRAIELDRDLSDRIQYGVVNIGPMTRGEMQCSITEPARKVGLEFEPGLVDTILADVGQEPGNLALLEFALTELWSRRKAHRLTREGYDAFDGVAGGIAHRAQATYDRLSAGEQAVARRVLTRLVRVARPGEGRQDTRVRMDAARLPADSDPVVKAFADARLLVTGREGPGARTVELAHEILIREWSLFRLWLQEDRKFLFWRQNLLDECAQWQRSGRVRQALLPNQRLHEAKQWLGERGGELSLDERRFVRASLRRRTRSRLLRLTGAVLIVCLLGLILAGWRSEQKKSRDLRLLAKVEKIDDPALRALLILELQDDIDPAYGFNVAQRAAMQPLPIAVLRHDESISLAKFGFDGKTIITVSNSGTALLWDSEGLAGPIKLPHDRPVAHVEMQPGGPHFATLTAASGPSGLKAYNVGVGSVDHVVRLWHPDGTGPCQELIHPGTVVEARFSGDGSRVFTAELDGDLAVWTSDGSASEPIAISSSKKSESSKRVRADRIAIDYNGTRVLWIADEQAYVAFADRLDAPLALPTTEAASEALFVGDGETVIVRTLATEPSSWGYPFSNELHVFSLDRPGQARVLEHEGRVLDVSLHPDGSRIATASEDGTARLWDLARPGQVLTFEHRFPVDRVALSPDGNRLATVTRDGSVQLWRADQPRQPVALRGGSSVRDLAWGCDGTCLATVAYDGETRIWNVDRTEEPLVLPGVASLVSPDVPDVEFSPEGDRVVTVARDGTARIWDTAWHGEPQVVQHDRAGRLSFSADGKLVAPFAEMRGTPPYSALDRVLVVRDTKGAEVAVLEHEGPIRSAEFCRDGSLLLTVAAERVDVDRTLVRVHDRAYVWRVIDGGPFVKLETADDVLHAHFLGGGRRIITADEGGHVRVWDPEGKEVVDWHREAEVRDLASSDDGSRIAVSWSDGVVRVYNYAIGGVLDFLHDDMSGRMALSQDGVKLATRSQAGRVTVWLTDGSRSFELPQEHPVEEFGFSPDGFRLFTRSSEGLRVWQIENPDLPSVLLDARGEPIHEQSFSADWSRVVTTHLDQSPQVWNVLDPSRDPLVLPHRGQVLSARYSPDGTRIATGDGSRLRLWRVTWEGLIDYLAGTTTACLTPEERQWYLEESPSVAQSAHERCEERNGRKVAADSS